jgi:hypothetical protein
MLVVNVEVYCIAGQATDDNTAQAHCMLGNYVYKYSIRICNIMAFPLQHLLHESASILRYMYIVSLVLIFQPFDSLKTGLMTASLNEPYLRK